MQFCQCGAEQFEPELEKVVIGSEIDELYHGEALPVCVRRDGERVNGEQLGRWWMSRSIPVSRIGLKEALARLDMGSSLELIEKCYGLSLSDQYWMNPEGKIDWADINFFENDFSEDMGKFLCGEKAEVPFELMSPDNTSDGWLQKKWKIINKERYLLKGGSMPYLQEPVNEVIATKLMERLPECQHVSYEVIYQERKPFSICQNFIDTHTEFVPAMHVYQSMDKDSDTGRYRHFLRCCEFLGIENVQKFLDKMLITDYIISNTDRHFGNFGFIRNVENYNFEGIAPIFDSGSSLFYNVLDNEIIAGKETAAKPFAETHQRQLGYISSFEALDIRALRNFPEQAREILREYRRGYSEVRITGICRSLEQRIGELENYAARFQQGEVQFVEKEDKINQYELSKTARRLETELLRNGFIPTETIMSNLRTIVQAMGEDVSLEQISVMYRNINDVDEELRDTIYQIGEELKEQEIITRASESLFIEP